MEGTVHKKFGFKKTIFVYNLISPLVLCYNINW